MAKSKANVIELHIQRRERASESWPSKVELMCSLS